MKVQRPRKRRTVACIQSIPLLNLVAHLEGPLPDPADVFAKLLKHVYDLLGEQTACVGMAPHEGSRIRAIPEFVPLSRLSSELSDIFNRTIAVSNLKLLTADETDYWRLAYWTTPHHVEFMPLDDTLTFDVYYDILPDRQMPEFFGKSPPIHHKLAEVCKSMIGVLDATGLCYNALVDVDISDNTSHGRFYSYLCQDHQPWPRLVEFVRWGRLGELRRERVRNLSWGTYLGPKMAARLDPDGTFIERFLQPRASDLIPEKAQSAIRFESGGMFLALSDDPYDCVEPHFAVGSKAPVVVNGAWLWEELTKAKMI